MMRFARLALFVLVAGVLGLGAENLFSPADAGWHEAEPIKVGDLTELHSQNGQLDVTLHARAEKVKLGDLELDGMTYNGQLAGPVFRLKPGDRLRVRLDNQLVQPTNLHFHGMHSSPLGDGDNVHMTVPPGQTFVYDIHIPAGQPPGLYWYHAHQHIVSEEQVMKGLTGTLVVEGPPQAVAERIFVLKEFTFDDDTDNAEIDDELHSIVQSINGLPRVALAMRPGESQLWRFTNQGANRAFHMALEGHPFTVVARDGEEVTKPEIENELNIMPGQRVDVLVQANNAGKFRLFSKGVMTGTGAARERNRVLGELNVAGPGLIDAAKPVIAPSPATDLRTAKIDARREVVFSGNTTLDPSKQEYFLNGRKFDHERVDFRVPLGNTEEWTVRNDSDDLHAFHIHQVSFQVVAINGKPVPFSGYLDVVYVPERGSVTLRMAFTDPIIVGRFMMHCHVLKHEDKGMMGQVEVYNPRDEMKSYEALSNFAQREYLHLWWWMHGVPWSQCGIADS